MVLKDGKEEREERKRRKVYGAWRVFILTL